MNRNERHAAILRLVREQPHLDPDRARGRAARAQGHEVVQTTVSRDIHELGLIKVRHAEREARLRARRRTADRVQRRARRTRSRAGRSTLEPSGNLVVVLTPYGYASALAQAIDVARHPHVAGTIAGENTVLLVSREPVTGAELVDELQSLRLQGAA